MNASMLLMTAWMAGADVVPAGHCAGCAAPAPAPVAAAPCADCGAPCDSCGSAKMGLLAKLKGMFAGGGGHKGKHHKGGCDDCAPAPACDGCGSSGGAWAPSVGAPVVVPGAPGAPAVMPGAPIAPNPVPAPIPSTLPSKPVSPTPAVPGTTTKPIETKPNGAGTGTGKSAQAEPAIGGGLIDIPVVTPVSGAPKAPALGSPANPF